MHGLMQDSPLVIPMILRRAMTLGTGMNVVSAEPGGNVRQSWSEIGERSMRLGAALDTLGVARSASVASFAWNGHRHLELYYGVPNAERVLHTVNVRLHPDDLVYVVDHAGDAVMFVDASLTHLLAPIRSRLGVGAFVVMEDGGSIDPAFADDPRYEELLAASDPVEPSANDEMAAASICHTSGTTGRPRAVAYSHRSIVLHSMSELMVDSHAVRRGDIVLPLAPMFHVNGWGLPYAAGFAPASLVLAGSDTSPAAVGRLIAAERPTTMSGIPTMWAQLESTFVDRSVDTSSVERILCGGAEPPPALIEHYTDLGIDFFHGWGMTEMSPSGTGTWIRGGQASDERVTRQGFPTPTVELRVVGTDGSELERDGTSVGELQVRGPWVAAAYFDPGDDANEARFDDDWLRTGDLARIHDDGSMEIVDRRKDLVKSGGEWISSVELERELAAHPSILEAAVIAVPHEHWGERPLALVVPRDDTHVVAANVREFLHDRVAAWWIPDLILSVGALPKTGVGKVDKRQLRSEYGTADGRREPWS